MGKDIAVIKFSAADVAIAGGAKASMDKGQSWADTLVLLANKTPIELTKVKLPGGIKPTFKEEAKAGLTNEQVFGEYTAEALYDRSFLQVRSGRYTGAVKASKTSGLSLGGHEQLGTLAAQSMVEAMAQADDVVTQDWAGRFFAGAAEVKIDTPDMTVTTTPPKRRRGAKANATA